MDNADLRSRVVYLEHKSTEDRQRISALEIWKSSKDVSDARSDEQMKALTEDVKTIKSGISRLFWIIVTAIVTAVAGIVVTLMMRGGVNIH